jgi:hypothetical protein
MNNEKINLLSGVAQKAVAIVYNNLICLLFAMVRPIYTVLLDLTLNGFHFPSNHILLAIEKI